MQFTIISLVTLFCVIGPSSAQTAGVYIYISGWKSCLKDRWLIWAVTSTIFNNIVRYTAFSSAAYGDTCANPPSGSSVVQYFNDGKTDTQATLFRDDTAKEIIIAFRGTSSPKDLDTDLDFLLVPLSATGTKCASCNVSTNKSVEGCNGTEIESDIAYRYIKVSRKHTSPLHLVLCLQFSRNSRAILGTLLL